jgi:DNA-binding CsgD family transcriptional regulator
MLIVNDAAVYTAANPAASNALGRSADEIVGRRVGFSTAAERRQHLQALWAEFERAGYVIVPWQITLPDGATVDVETSWTRDTPEPGQHLVMCWRRLIASRGSRLSRREQEITGLLARGLTGAQIAQRLCLSPHTVRTHVRNAMEHIGARTRAELVARALTEGLIAGGPSPG